MRGQANGQDLGILLNTPGSLYPSHGPDRQAQAQRIAHIGRTSGGFGDSKADLSYKTCFPQHERRSRNCIGVGYAIPGRATGIVAYTSRDNGSGVPQERTDRVGCPGSLSEARHSLFSALLPRQGPARTASAIDCFQPAGLRPRCPGPRALNVSARLRNGKGTKREGGSGHYTSVS